MLHYDLDGRLAIVTGGAQSIGLAIARALVSARATVLLWDRSAEALAAAAELGLGVTTAQVDVTDPEAVAAAARAAQSAHGRIAILINNAGILGPVAPSWEVDVAAFRHVIDVNLTGAFICARAIVPLMLAPPTVAFGRIVNLVSTQAKEGTALASAYAASKAGLVALTKTLGKELASTGILVNAVAPTAVETAMAAELTPERRAELLGRIPMGRFVEPDEVAAQVLWLCSEACSFATGAVFDMSGGRATY